jgi:hypothetical protein
MASHKISHMQTWTQRIEALEALGWSLAAIARAVGCSQQAIGDLKHGRTKEPTGMSAVRLHALSSKRVKPQHSDAKRRAGRVTARRNTTKHKTS